MKVHWVALVLLVAACAKPETPLATTPPGTQGAIAGFAIRGEHIGTSARIRVDEGRRPVELRISLIADGREVWSGRDTVPFCPAATDCWWGNAFFDDELARHDPPIDDIRVEVAPGEANDITGDFRELDVTHHADEVTMQPPGIEGTVYLVAFDGDRPTFGVSFFTEAGSTSLLHYGPALFPLRPGERARAFHYAGPIPARVTQPDD